MEGCHIWSPGAEFYNRHNSHNSQEFDANLHMLHKDYVGHGEHRLVQHATCGKRLKKKTRRQRKHTMISLYELCIVIKKVGLFGIFLPNYHSQSQSTSLTEPPQGSKSDMQI